MKQQLLNLSGLLGGFALARRATRRSLRILCYHGLWTAPGPKFGDRLFIEPAQFEARMRWLAASGYPLLPLGEAIRLLAEDRLPDAAVAVTIDDGWASTHSHMLPVLERYRIPATVYVTTWYVENQLPLVSVTTTYILRMSPRAAVEWAGETHPLESIESREAVAIRIAAEIDRRPLAERAAALLALSDAAGVPPEPWRDTRQFTSMTPAEVADAAARGLDVQLHTHRHIRMESFVERLETEIADNRRALAAATGLVPAAFDQFCYPNGSYNPDADAILRNAGVRSATLVDQGLNAPGTNPYRLRRFLDGRSVSQTMFEAYLSGALDLGYAARNRMTFLPQAWIGLPDTAIAASLMASECVG